MFWKTGTSCGSHGAWTAGGFGPYVLVVWVGNFDSSSNPAFVGATAAAPLFFCIHDAPMAARAQMPVKQPPRNPGCTVAGRLVGDPPRITSPLRGNTYTLRLADGRIAFTATSDADVGMLYWFVDHAVVCRTRPGQTLAWRPRHAGSYRVQVVDDYGRSDARRLRVGLVW